MLDINLIRERPDEVKAGIAKTAEERRQVRLEEARRERERDGKTKLERTVSMPSEISSGADLEELIRQLQDLQSELTVYSGIQVTFEIKG